MSWTARAVARNLGHLHDGRIFLHDGEREEVFGEDGALHASVTVHDPRFYRAVALGGHVGAAETYMDGWWSADDLVSLVRILVRNRDTLDGLETGTARLVQPIRALLHWLDRNTRPGSRRNIAAHYDLGNAFFETFLDETLTYSCGIFERPHSSLKDASIAKYDRLCRKLQLGPDDHVLEIGTGWGGFALHAAGRYGSRVTTTTISEEQFRLATDRVRRAGLENRVSVITQDYRDLRGRFDKLVSIEMIEAVGHQFFGTFFEQCAALLSPHGRMALQAITIQDRYYEQARREVDFIKRYIFPGSCIPSVSTLAGSAGTTDLRLVHLEDITAHYAETLRRWRHNFSDGWDRIRSLGFSETFRRLWEFYFCYCEGGFREAAIGNVQMVFSKPDDVGALPQLAALPEVVAA